MITVPEAARRLHLSPETIRRWIRAGRLRAQEVEGQPMIDERDLDALRESGTLLLPDGWRETATGEPTPDVLGALGRSRKGR